MKNKYIILFAIILYGGIFLCHDAIFSEYNFLLKNIYTSKVTALISNSHQSNDNASSKLFTQHKCPFCDGFINDAEVQEIASIDLFAKRTFSTYIPSYEISLLICNPKRAPPLAS